MNEERVALAEAFLTEAVYRSRGSQAGAALFAVDAGEGNCGLGASAAVVLDLTPRGEELFRELFGELTPGGTSDLEAIRGVMAAWIKRQDGLDRRRNHFLRDFRGEHGADRRAYPPEILRAYGEGLERVNRAVSDGRRRAAEELLAAATPPTDQVNRRGRSGA